MWFFKKKEPVKTPQQIAAEKKKEENRQKAIELRGLLCEMVALNAVGQMQEEAVKKSFYDLVKAHTDNFLSIPEVYLIFDNRSGLSFQENLLFQQTMLYVSMQEELRKNK